LFGISPTAERFLAGQKVGEGGTVNNQTTAWKGKYDTPEMHDAVERITVAGQKHGILPLGAGLRWLAYHSELGEEDGIILGASTYEELEEKVREIAKGPLPEEMVGLMEDARKRQRDGMPRGS
jgi:aflatoxin B1 aldehyde reductase